MKRTERRFGVILLALVFAFASCEKDITTSELTLDLTKKATVKVYFFAELDKTIQGLELVPNGTKVLVTIPNSSFNAGVAGNWIDSAKVNNGFIEVKVPTTSTGVTVTFKSAEFTYDQVQPYGSVSNKISKIYSVTAAQTISVFPGESKTKEITYDGQNQLDNFVEKVNVKFELKADIDDTNDPDREYVPSTTVVTFYTATWSATATVGEKGTVTVDAPKGEKINIRFDASKTIWVVPATIPASKETKKYRYTYEEYQVPSITEPSLKQVDCGEGVLWQ